MKRTTFSTFRSLLATELRDQLTFPVIRFVLFSIGLGVTLISIIFSVYASVFSQGAGTFGEYVWGPDDAPLSVDNLMAEALQPADEQKPVGKGKLYVFALDVSGSLDVTLDQSEAELFKARIRRLNLRTETECLANLDDDSSTRWHLARSQVCSMLERIPNGAHVGMWTFGTKTKQLTTSPYWLFEHEQDNLTVPHRKTVVDALMEAEMVPRPGKKQYDKTNFVTLLDDLRSAYIEHPELNWTEIHFIMISDFLQDTDQGESLREFTARQIQMRFRELSKKNVMFHLSSFSDGLHDVSSVVRLAQENVEWFRCRVDQPISSELNPEFAHFFSFRPVREPIRFFHQVDSRQVIPLRLKKAQTWPSELVLGLMKDAYSRQHDDLVLQITKAIDGKCPATWEQTGELVENADLLKVTEHSARALKHKEDYLCLQPLSIPQIGGTEYRLTLADITLNGGAPYETREATRITTLLRIEFVEYLPSFARWILFTGLGLVILPVPILLVWLIFLWRRAKRKRGSRPEDTTVATNIAGAGNPAPARRSS